MSGQGASIRNQGMIVRYHRSIAILLLLDCLSAHAASPSRAWDFDQPTAGSYKVQIEHDGRGFVPDGTPVTYAFTVGNEIRSHSYPLRADQAFIGLTLGAT